MGYELLYRRPKVLFKSLFLLACLSVFGWHPSMVNGQAIVQESRHLTIPVHYEKVLSRLDGKEAATEMFASQHVALMEYKPRKADSSSNDKQEEGVTRATIDIVGYSHEFGTMYYLMSIVASEKQTTILVELVKPVGMLRHQQYRYEVTPRAEDRTAITIFHELDVVLMQRKLRLVNRIISKVTYKKACEELHTLTGKMVDSVHCIASRERPKATVSDKRTTTNDEEDLEEAVDESPKKEASPYDQKKDEPKEESRMADSGDFPSASPDKGSIAPNGQDSSTNSAENAPSKSNPPMASSPADNSERTNNVDVAVNPPKSQRSRSEIQPEQPPFSESQTSTVSDKITPKDSADGKPVEKERPKEKDETSLAPATSSSPAKANTNPPAPEEPIKPKKNDLRVVIEGVPTSSGTVRIAIFANEKQFKAFDARKEEDSQGEAFKKVGVRVKKSGTLIYEFKDIPYGSYVIAAFHDQDGNKKLNSSFIGLPSEPYGFTRDARSNFGAPRYDDAVIQFDDKNSSFEFKLK